MAKKYGGKKEKKCKTSAVLCPHNPYPNKPWILRVCHTSLLKTLGGKGKNARNEQFLLFPQYLLPFQILYIYFVPFPSNIKSLSAYFHFGSLKFVVWERVDISSSNGYSSESKNRIC